MSVRDLRIFSQLSDSCPHDTFHAGHVMGLRNNWLAKARSESPGSATRRHCVGVARKRHWELLKILRITAKEPS